MWLLLTSYFTFGSVYMSMSLSYFVPAYPSGVRWYLIVNITLKIFSILLSTQNCIHVIYKCNNFSRFLANLLLTSVLG